MAKGRTKRDPSKPDPPASKAPVKRTSDVKGNPFSVQVSARFLLLTFLLSAVVVPLSIGTVCRAILLRRAATPPDAAEDRGDPPTAHVPRPFESGSDAPLAAFTTKILREKARRLEGGDDEEDSDDDDDSDDDEDEADLGDNDSLHPLYEPFGEHLLIDIKHVDPYFLNSEERLARAMFDLFEELGAALLSYTCRSVPPMGVSCVGVASKRHVALHTWPLEGAIVIDVYAPPPITDKVSVVEKLFAVPTKPPARRPRGLGGPPTPPETRWSQKLRGHRGGYGSYENDENPPDNDLTWDVLIRHHIEQKKVLLSAKTTFQRVDVVEMVDPRSIPVGSYKRPDRVLYLDRSQQSTLYGEAEYHEALVHPAMIVHPDPRRVAIIGGGEGATLREVLKHSTLDKVFMVEIDGELVGMCREFLPEWSDCSDVAGSDADSCFDDSRAEVVFADAFGWFIDRFGAEPSKQEEKLDVIIMDALDPDKLLEIVSSLYKDNHFIESLFNGLSEEGVLVLQLGEADSGDDAATEIGPFREAANMMEGLEKAGFESMHVYYEDHSHFQAPWSYLVCFKDAKSRDRWYRSAAEIAVELHRRLPRTRSGGPPLRYLDPSAMVGYQVPSRPVEVTYCRKEVVPWECDADLRAAEGASRPRQVYSPVLERHPVPVASSAVQRLSSKRQALVGKVHGVKL